MRDLHDHQINPTIQASIEPIAVADIRIDEGPTVQNEIIDIIDTPIAIPVGSSDIDVQPGIEVSDGIVSEGIVSEGIVSEKIAVSHIEVS